MKLNKIKEKLKKLKAFIKEKQRQEQKTQKHENNKFTL
jgi:hypothetical protein